MFPEIVEVLHETDETLARPAGVVVAENEKDGAADGMTAMEVAVMVVVVVKGMEVNAVVMDDHERQLKS